MTYFKINGIDFSKCVNALSVTKNHLYKSQQNARGDTIVKYKNTKRIIDVGIIPLSAAEMKTLQAALNNIAVTISFLNPTTGVIEENVKCMIPTNSVEYYTIRAGKTSFKQFSLQFSEL